MVTKAPLEPRRAQASMERPTDMVPMIRARLIGESSVAKGIGQGATEGSNQMHPDNALSAFAQQGAIEPPYDPEMLCLLFEHSAGLRPNVDSYATNIDGFGYRLEPLINLESDEGRRRLSAVLRRKKKTLKKSTPRPGTDNWAADGPEIEDSDLREALGELADEMFDERSRLERFFENCCMEHSFVKTRRMTRQDMEIMGNAYWEVLRTRDGDVAQFVYVPGYTVRLLPLGPPVDIEVNVRVDEIHFESIRRRKRFRIYIQIVDSMVVFFKEFGDPRIVSSKTGRVWESVDMMRAEEGADIREATEVIHFQIESPMSSYGVPRWVGALLAVMGSRQSEEVNFLYFENKSVPPLALLVSGGRLSEDSVKRIEDHITTNIKGKHNFHKMLVIEAEPAAGGTAATDTSARMKIQIQPLTGAQQNDALFQKYDERNMDKVGGSFRLPRLLRGDIRDFNRSTAMAALNFAEMQVFQPEREDFDWIINKVLRDMGVRFWKFVSRAPVTRDPVAMAEIIRNLLNAGALVPEEGRELAEDVFNRDFRKLDAQWVKQPLQMTLAGIPAQRAVSPSGVDTEDTSRDEDDEGEENDEGDEDETTKTRRRLKAKKILRLRNELEKAEEEAWRDILRSRNL